MSLAFSSANVDRQRKQLGGLFKDMWMVEATMAGGAIAAAAEDTATVTVSGVDVSKGDSVMCYGFNADPEPNIFNWEVQVSADNTLEFAVTNLSGSSDTPGPTKVWALVVRPNWNPGT